MLRLPHRTHPRLKVGGREPHMAGQWASAFKGATRSIVCPACKRAQVVPRRPLPDQVYCKNCGKTLTISKTGTVKVAIV